MRSSPFAWVAQGWAWGPEDLASSVEVLELAPGEQKEVRLTLSAPGLLRCVAGRDGEGPLANGSWEFAQVGDAFQRQLVSHELKTPEVWLPVGDYELSFVKEVARPGQHRMPRHAPGDGRRFQIRSDEATEISLAPPERTELRCMAVCRGRPAGDLAVWLVPEDAAASLHEYLREQQPQTFARTGSFALQAVPPGRYLIVLRQVTNRARWIEPLDVSPGQQVVHKEITLAAGEVQVFVRPDPSATEAARSELGLWLTAVNSSADWDRDVIWLRTELGEGGTALIPDVPPGRYCLRAQGAGGTLGWADEVIVRCDESVRVAVDLAPCVQVAFRVVDPTGTPLGAMVHARGVSNETGPRAEAACLWLWPGPHRVEVTFPWPQLAGEKLVEEIVVAPGKRSEHVIVVRD
jgi:hypothetical protein